MKKIFFAVLLFVTGISVVSCGMFEEKSSTDQAIEIIEKAIQEVKDAETLDELNTIEYNVLIDIEKCSDDEDYKGEAQLLEEAGRINKAFMRLKDAIRKKAEEL